MILKLFYLFIFFIPTFISAQSFILSGYISDKASGEILIGAHISIDDSELGTTTNEYGFYSIVFPYKKVSVVFSYIGYETQTVILELRKNTIMNIELSGKSLEEIIITEQKTHKNERLQKINIPLNQLTSIPTLGGETDIMKSLSLFPGISTGQEGSSNLYIRGGTPDQNLILLDGIPIYNATHLGGFFSIFNTNAIKNIEVYKGNFPARYGGRLSSVIDITMKEGNDKKVQGNFGLGILTSHFAIEGPFKKEKSSYLLTARSSYLGLINLLRQKENTDNYLDYWLYDINVKTNFQLKKAKLFFSLYSGNDVGTNYDRSASSSGGQILAQYLTENQVRWGNTITSSRYVIPISPRIYGKFLAGLSTYNYQFINETNNNIFMPIDTIVEKKSFQNSSKIKDVLLRADFDFSLNPKHYLKYGTGITFHQFQTASGDNTDSLNLKNNYPSKEYYLYIEDNMTLNPHFSINPGIRWSGFNTPSQYYFQFEPRIATQYFANKNLTLNASFSIVQQYIHLLSSSGFGFPNDIWVTATESIPPQNVIQTTLGGKFIIFKDISLSMETYYKKMKNLIDYKVGIDNVFSTIGDWEKLVETQGEGNAYGIEWLLEKEKGKLMGFMGYSLSWNNRQFDNINQGKKYPFTYDRRHDFSLVLHYKLSSKHFISTNWIYQTGTAVTLPVASLPLPPNAITSKPVFIGRNNGRLPTYHRLDIGYEYKKTTKKGHLRIWKISIYNVYNRKNPSYLLIQSEPILDNEDQFLFSKNKVEQISLFSIIPALSLEYKFKK